MVNGIVEGAEFLGIEPTPNEEYYKYCKSILEPIKEINKRDRTSELMFNTECVPTSCGNLVA